MTPAPVTRYVDDHRVARQSEVLPGHFKMDEDEDIVVYSKGYYLHYAQGDQVFADFLYNQDVEKAEKNRRIFKWTDVDGVSHSVRLPEDQWRSTLYRSFPVIKTFEKKRDQSDKPDVDDNPVGVDAQPDTNTDPEVQDDTSKEVDPAEKERELEELEKQRSEERAQMRKKCMMAAETRRWDIRGWSQKKRKLDNGKTVSVVPSLSELAEKALQLAFELSGEDLKMHPLFLKMRIVPTPVEHNGELCRVFRHRPAVE